jgi:hypothetical protein
MHGMLFSLCFSLSLPLYKASTKKQKEQIDLRSWWQITCAFFIVLWLKLLGESVKNEGETATSCLWTSYLEALLLSARWKLSLSEPAQIYTMYIKCMGRRGGSWNWWPCRTRDACDLMRSLSAYWIFAASPNWLAPSLTLSLFIGLGFIFHQQTRFIFMPATVANLDPSSSHAVKIAMWKVIFNYKMKPS